ncbi:TPA: hypothetical protein N0F65_006901 [Lagenidium giganteum]|uniref:GST N-terminal domain-containing protein n=1 Tax=Lagenidium giganteum TaxID=4803 RepID=A0AAV2ZH42_9STRA|nr:TPA: hypothetical protein N0F65_006901 [Lagenidium giganteum]
MTKAITTSCHAGNAVLVSIPVSNYVEKARWALQLAQLPFTEEKHVPIGHYLSTKPKQGRSVPLLYFPSTKRALTDSADILGHCAESLSSLYPNEEVTELELFYDQKLGTHVRRIFYHLILNDEAVARQVLLGPVEDADRAAAIPFPKVIDSLKQGYDITDQRTDSSWTKVETILKHHESKLGDGPPGSRYLCGDTFSAADITLSAHLSLLLFPREHKYLAPFGFLADAPGPHQDRLRRLRESKLGQHALWCYEHHRPPMQ